MVAMLFHKVGCHQLQPLGVGGILGVTAPRPTRAAHGLSARAGPGDLDLDLEDAADSEAGGAAGRLRA